MVSRPYPDPRIGEDYIQLAGSLAQPSRQPQPWPPSGGQRIFNNEEWDAIQRAGESGQRC